MNIESIDMANEETERGDIPLYVKVPSEIHDYLNDIKEQTGITKTDAVTLIMEIASKFITPEQLSKLFDDYMLLGRDGLHISNVDNGNST